LGNQIAADQTQQNKRGLATRVLNSSRCFAVRYGHFQRAEVKDKETPRWRRIGHFKMTKQKI
jgi:hypothetical protein